MNNHKNTNEQLKKDLLETTFNDIFNIEEIQRLQDLFADAHEVASIITNIDGRPITKPSNFTYFCENIIRKTDRGCLNCYKSDAVLGRYNPKSANVQQCLSSGLWDAGVSITVGGKHIGNWLIGQVRNENIDENKLIEYADEIGVDRAKFKAALLDVPIMSEKKFRKIANLLFVIANELSEKAYSNILLKNQIIESNLAQNALLEAEWKFKALFDLGSIGVAYHRMIYDEAGEPFDYYFIDANDSYKTLTGINPKGMTARQAFPGIENDPSDWIGMYGYVAKTGKTIHFEQYLESNRRWYDCVGYQYKPDHFVAAFTEVTKRKETELALIESEKELRNLIELSPVSMCIIRNWKTVYFNPAALQLFGAKSLSEVVNRNILDFVHPNDHELVSKNSDVLKNKGYIPKQEQKYLKLDGSILDVESLTKSIKFNKNPATLVVINDITERKQNEYKILLNSKRLKALVDLLQYSTDSLQDYLDYALTLAIEITESKIGYIYHYNEEKKEFVLDTWSKEVMNECKIIDRQSVYQLDKTGLWGEAVRQRKPIMVNDFQTPHPLKKGYPEGHSPLYKYLTIPIFNDTEIVGVVGVANKETDYVDDDIIQLTILMDIVWKSKEKKKSEIALIENEEKYRLLLENSGIGIGVYNLDGRVLLFNQKALQNLGGKIEDYIGKSLLEIFGEEIGSMYLKRMQDSVKSETSLEFEDNFHSVSGDYWFLSNHTRIKNASGEIIGVQVLSHDITERKKAENALIKKIDELDYMNKFMVNREVRMAEMKREVNELLEKLGEEKRYL